MLEYPALFVSEVTSQASGGYQVNDEKEGSGISLPSGFLPFNYYRESFFVYGPYGRHEGRTLKAGDGARGVGCANLSETMDEV